MKEYFQISQAERNQIKNRIVNILEQRPEIVFAYLHGSFLSSPCFKDIDLAVYVDPNQISSKDMLNYELQLSAEVVLPYPVDIRILNNAPLGFQNNAARQGELLFSKNDELLSNFLEKNSCYMTENNYLIRESLIALSA